MYDEHSKDGVKFAFYDLETTGLEPCYDHALQFSAVLTDENLQIIDSVNFRGQLAPHIVPSPEALMVTGIDSSQLVDGSIPSHFEFSRKIMNLINEWSPAIWTGYNSIKFDEEFMRQMFYQNMHSNIYATQMNGNRRLDIMNAVIGTWSRSASIINIPEFFGNISLKLEHIASANGFDSDSFHDALVDVKATIHIARLIAKKDPELWRELVNSSSKYNVESKLESFQPVRFSARYKGNEPKSMLGCFCGYSEEYANHACFIDFDKISSTGELREIMKMNSDELQRMMKLPVSDAVFHKIAINKSPALIMARKPYKKHLKICRAIEEDPVFRMNIGKAMAKNKPYNWRQNEVKHVEQKIYDGFINDSDRSLLKEFHEVDWNQRNEIIHKLEDKRLRQLGRRVMVMYSPCEKSSEDTIRFHEFLDERWNAKENVKWMTIKTARDKIDEIRESKNAVESMITNISNFIDEREELLTSA